MRTSLLFLGVFLILCSCTKKKEIERKDLPVKVSVTDSLSFKGIIAVQPLFQAVSEDYVFFRDVGSPRVMVFEKSGQLMYDWAKKGDDPGAFMIVTDNLVCTPMGELVTHDAMKGIKSFSPSGELVFSKKSMVPPDSFHELVNLFRTSQVIKKDGELYLLHHRDHMMRDQVWDPGFFRNRKNLLMTNLESGDQVQLLPFPEESKFLNGKAFVFEDFRPVFFFDDKEQLLYLIFQNEAILYQYDFSGEQPELINRFPLDIPGFVGSVGEEFENLRYGRLKGEEFAARVLGMEKVGDNILVSYTRSATSEELRELEGVEDRSERRKKVNALRGKLNPEVLIFRGGEVLTYHVDMPEMAFDSFRVFDDEFWFMKPGTKEEEQEDFTVYRGKLIFED
ncbi:NHL repeat-containing protein [Echinicola salinicaeni]|uniref:hypothetical protein n=1 Tax=Echinicola salinicaeni TaxID=2762757 RepID=UPI00164751BF|nr:hypothetical protein [Echinicola salinicaeni]